MVLVALKKTWCRNWHNQKETPKFNPTLNIASYSYSFQAQSRFCFPCPRNEIAR